MFDCIIEGGTVIDGTKAPRIRADIGITDDRIRAIGDLSAAQATQRIDARDKIVAPGFVDVHNHSDGWLLKKPHLLPKTTQGFTTEVLMADGISYAPVTPHTARDWIFYLKALNGLGLADYSGWESLEDYLNLLDGRTVQNVATHVPYANIRANVRGWGRGAVDDFQMRQIKAAIAEGMEQGGVGLSTGLDYICQCFSTTDELADACTAMAAAGGLYVSHVRYKRGTMDGIREAVDIGRRAGVPVHISHLKGGDPQAVEEILEYLEIARREVDLSFDVYPYSPGSTMLSYLVPYDVWEEGPIHAISKLADPVIRERAEVGLKNYKLPLDEIHIAWTHSKENSRHQGKPLDEYVAETGKPAADALMDLLIDERLGVLLVFNEGDDRHIDPILQHDLYMMGTDGIYCEDGPVHPRMYGSAPRLLGPLVRDRKLFSLEESVYKLAGYPAQRFGLVNRGELREGNYADVVVFDAETVTDHATYDDPRQLSTGIEHVLVNGVPIIADGVAVDQPPEGLPGRYLKFHRDE
ncbi:D-aminoacylase [Symmachiella dynata]|uniref:N-acyl-D-amino-acid deacylase family protein n=1 Tax=Symmachiella dynata TaxID=2527995 RepID=UPI0011885275|nr:D-aminoacylase [Symmachiella dynata]QDT46777.1 D-aminoacylase [Symmachiella dynata]